MIDWYVLQTLTGTERDAVNELRKLGFEAFSPSRTMLEQHGKAWKEVERTMIAGYVFVGLHMSVRAYTAIKAINGIIRFLGSNMPETVPNDQMARMFILANDGQPWGVSEGRKVDDALVIDEGPLKGREDWIRTNDARRHRAKVEIAVLGESKTIELALKVTNRQADATGDTSPDDEAADQTDANIAAESWAEGEA